MSEILNIEKIKDELLKKFGEPLKEFYSRRIVFWYDEEKQFEQDVKLIEIPNVKLIILTENNNFEVKKILQYDDLDSNYLVYSTNSYKSPEDNWLLGLELQNEVFRADLYSLWLSELKLDDNRIYRNLVKKYSKFFASQERRRVFAEYSRSIVDEKSFKWAILFSVINKKKYINSKPSLRIVIMELLNSGLDESSNSIYKQFKKYELWDQILKLCEYLGFVANKEESFLRNLATHLFLSASTKFIDVSYLIGLQNSYSDCRADICYDVISFWSESSESRDKNNFKTTAEFVEEKCLIKDRLLKASSITDYLSIPFLPCVNECVLLSLMTEISNFLIDVEKINNAISIRKNLLWFDTYENVFVAVELIAKMKEFLNNHGNCFIEQNSELIWNNYVSDYYQMDQLYRKLHVAYKDFVKNSDAKFEHLEDSFKDLLNSAENIYQQGFLDPLSDNWSQVSEKDLESGKILGITPQDSFYNFYVRRNSEKLRTYVIISDAMRYEVAQSLYEELKIEKECQVQLDSMLGIFPSLTEFGMPALLPHNNISIELNNKNKLKVLIDGHTTDMCDRDSILKLHNERSVALKFKEIEPLKKAERQLLVRDTDVVYIYHDKIDESSHSSNGCDTFIACRDAIQEIKRIVNIIINEFNGSKIIITSDHGFLYSYSKIEEYNKVDKVTSSDSDIEVSRRHQIIKKGENIPDNLIKVKLRVSNDNFEAFSPRGTQRLKVKSGGLNFVHGGASLQELVIPVIDFTYKKKSKDYIDNKDKYEKKFVSLKLLSTVNKITNLCFKLSFYQQESVQENYQASLYNLYFVDDKNNRISDLKIVNADINDENEQNRKHEVSFNLNQQAYSKTEKYYLIIENKNSGEVPQKVEFSISIVFAMDDFGFDL